MTKKVLILSSSPRRGGNSDNLFATNLCEEQLKVVTKQKRFSCVTRQSIIAQGAAHVACTENLARRKTMRQRL